MRSMAWHSGWRPGRREPHRDWNWRGRHRPRFRRGRRPTDPERSSAGRWPPAGARAGRSAQGASRRKGGRRGGRLLLLGCLLLLTVVLAGIDYSVTPVISAWAEQYGRNLAQQAMAEAAEVVFREQRGAEEFVHIEKTDDGKLIVMPEWGRLNSLAARLELAIQGRLDRVVMEQSPIPLGQILGLNFLAGFGPKIQVHVMSSGALTTTLQSQLREAGINQTLHSIYIDMESTVKILVPTVTQEIKVAKQVPISETMLVGDVPEWYMTGYGRLEELPMGIVPLQELREDSS